MFCVVPNKEVSSSTNLLDPQAKSLVDHDQRALLMCDLVKKTINIIVIVVWSWIIP